MTSTYTVFDPATLESVGEAPEHTAVDVDKRVRTAHAALHGWAEDEVARRSALQACAAAVRADATRLSDILSREQGKPRAEAEGEFLVGAGMLDYYSRLDWNAETPLPDREGRTVRVDRLPVGVVGTITPWNFPISLLLVKLAPALAAGCTVVAKPSPTTPLSTIALIDLMSCCLPANVLQWSTSSDRTVNVALAEHPLIRKISFTGSTDVGTRIMAQAAPLAKRLTMELGGNDPAIVLEDADADFTGTAIAASAFRNAGQVCMAAKRVYVPRSLAGPICEALVAATETFVLGHGIDPATTMGPMHNQSQLDTVTGMVEDALARGGRRLTSGGRGCQLAGHFMAPTIITDLNDDAPLVANEQFGAALPVVLYDDLEGLAARLNGQPWGLGASVWSPDLERADSVARTLQAGTVWINQHTRVEQDAPFGGWRMSGIGRERGPWGLEHYQELRTVNTIAHGGLR